jgi:hypothetical protein
VNLIDRVMIEESAHRLAQELERVEQRTRHQEVRQMRHLLGEAIDSGDWSKVGVIVGILWQRLDTLINAVRDVRDELRRSR